jgi:flagellum-specific peptidoglycan hydrolase FlgJ
VHTLPLPEVTNATENTKSENGNSKLTSPPTVLQVLNFNPRGPAGSPQNPKIEDRNSKPVSAQAAPQGSTSDLRTSALSPQNTKTEDGNSKLDTAQAAPRASNFDFRVSAPSLHLIPQQLQFLLRVTPAAVAGQHEYGIPACVTIAQAILESATPKFGWGSSELFRIANNPFGIKYCHFPSGDRVIGRSGEREKSDHPITGSPGHPISEDYGAFDAPTWEIENGQKKVMIA